MTGTDFTAAATDYTMTPAGSVVLAGGTYTVERQTYFNGTETIWLTGPRGASYFLRRYLGEDTGARQVINWKTGRELRVRGNEVRAFIVGDLIEQGF